MSNLTSILRNNQPKKFRDSPLWSGPCGEDSNSGITFSLLSRFLSCRERFRILVIDGLQPTGAFNHRLSYGDMWHLCEQYHAEGLDPTNKSAGSWEEPLLRYARKLGAAYPQATTQIEHWYEVCKVQFPKYIKYWSKQPERLSRKTLFAEESFSIPYQLPSGRFVKLRGKWDSVDLLGGKRSQGIYLQENKTKGDINVPQIKRQLTFDLQTMIYLTALHLLHIDQMKTSHSDFWRKHPSIPKGIADLQIKGVIYNVVRRPLSGGKGSIKRHKATKHKRGESKPDFYRRLGNVIDGDLDSYFVRFEVGISRDDLAKFRHQCLDPILENLCDWWNQVTGNKWIRPKGYRTPMNWRHPFGVFNSLDEGGSSDLDEFLLSGSTLGLTQVTNLFPELSNGKKVSVEE